MGGDPFSQLTNNKTKGNGLKFESDVEGTERPIIFLPIQAAG